MVTTDDGTMAKVQMLKEPFRTGEPIRYLPIDEALRMEASGDGKIVRKSNTESYETTPEGLVVVKNIHQSLIESYGPYSTYGLATAEAGEREGKWRIRRKGEDPAAYDTRMMTPRIFKALGRADVYGPDHQEYDTKGIKKKTVAWIEDNFIRGGAEISSEFVRYVGTQLGFQIEIITQGSSDEAMKIIFSRSDLVIISNIWGFSQLQMRALLEAIYSDGLPYVKYEHDHRELDRPEFSRRLYENAAMNVFLSPIHMKNHEDRLGIDLSQNSVCLPLAIDADFYRPVQNVERKKGAALVCNMRHFKSWTKLQNYIDQHPEIKFTILSNNGNLNSRPMVAPEKMPEVYSEHEFLVHLLDGWGAGERVVFEAALCGCRIVANDHVGHMSWGRDLADDAGLREWLKQAPYDFWREVDKRIS